LKLLFKSLKLSVLLGKLSDLLVCGFSEFLILLLFSHPLFFRIAEFSPGFVQLKAELFIGPLLLFALKIAFSSGTIKLVLFGIQLALKRIEIVCKLIDSIMVRLAVSLQVIRKSVDSSSELLVLVGVFVLLLL